jgi:mycofactocin precursor
MQQPSEQSVTMADEPGEVIEEESLIEEISIDGMCGVY